MKRKFKMLSQIIHLHLIWMTQWRIGGTKDRRPLSLKLFVSVQFSEKIMPNNRLTLPGIGTPWEILDPPLLL